jgi:hypothetical protein
LFAGGPGKADYSFPHDPRIFTWRNFFLVLNWG